ncbi:MAG: hypothetical protein ACNS62_20010 [Candidatus Cyclobacteriaceae bacterium M3_2C_046]
MVKIFKFIWFISLLLFLASFLWVYAYLPGEAQIWAGEDTSRDITISKDMFFYGGLLIFMIINVIFYLFSGVWSKNVARNVSQPEFRDFKINILNWLISFNVVINFFLIISIILIGSINQSQPNPAISILMYVGPAFIIIWLISLAVIMIKRKS